MIYKLKRITKDIKKIKIKNNKKNTNFIINYLLILKYFAK